MSSIYEKPMSPVFNIAYDVALRYSDIDPGTVYDIVKEALEHSDALDPEEAEKALDQAYNDGMNDGWLDGRVAAHGEIHGDWESARDDAARDISGLLDNLGELVPEDKMDKASKIMNDIENRVQGIEP